MDSVLAAGQLYQPLSFWSDYQLGVENQKQIEVQFFADVLNGEVKIGNDNLNDGKAAIKSESDISTVPVK